MKIFRVSNETNLKDFTDCVFPQGGFCLAALLRGKDIKVNGARVNKNVPLSCGDEVVYYTSPKQEAMPSHLTAYEDGNIYIADKFSGVSTEGLLSELSSRGEFYAVHRLDRNTRGLIVFAKNKSAEGELLRAFKERKVHKKYIALCENRFKKDADKMTAYLKKDEKNSLVKICPNACAGGVEIITEYRILKRSGDVALAEITLHTGRTHQIRAHFAYIGCPVLGDGKYGDSAFNKKYSLARQQLISKHLLLDVGGGLSYLNGRVFESCFGFSDFPF